MKRPSYKSIKEAGKKSKRAAVNSSIQKYVYLLQLSKDKVRELDEKYIKEDGCALCRRYIHKPKRICPLLKKSCNGGSCILEWSNMKSAYDYLCLDGAYPDYYEFMYYASQILIKLLQIKGTI